MYNVGANFHRVGLGDTARSSAGVSRVEFGSKMNACDDNVIVCPSNCKGHCMGLAVVLVVEVFEMPTFLN